MTDLVVVSTKNDIDNNTIDIDVNPMFQWLHFPYRTIKSTGKPGEETPRQPDPNRTRERKK